VKILALILSDAPLPAILQSIVEMVQSQNPAMICSVMFTGQRIISGDLQTDPNWTDYQEMTACADLACCWSQPIFSADHRVLGTFDMYHRQPCAPTPNDIATITAAAQLTAFAIEQKQNQESLQWRTAFFEAQIESSMDGILIVDSQGKMIQQNHRMAELWKIPREILESNDDAAALAFVTSQIKDPQKFLDRVTYLYAHPTETSRDEIELVDGTVLDRDSAPVYGKTGKCYGRIWRFRDITDRKAMEEELRTAARTDRLTGLPNRTLLIDRLQQTIAQHRRMSEFRYAVLFMDFDRFKMVNDTFGHEMGDQLLREIARRLTVAVREVDSVSRDASASASRLGGDEFVILLTHLRSDTDAGLVAERILTAMSVPYNLGGQEIISTASIGIVTSEFGHESAEDVLRDADTAMYAAKTAGKGRAAWFDESMRTRAQRKADLENGLHRAEDTGQLLPQYQPITHHPVLYR
jgi:diguanylate cyclase (GGDEF)-like protein